MCGGLGRRLLMSRNQRLRRRGEIMASEFRLNAGTTMRFSFFVVGVAVLVSACAAENAEDVASDIAPVIGGAVTRDRPEVGMASFSWGSYCTATLIAPRVAITASHCVEYASRDATGYFGSFRIDKAGSGSEWYDIDRYRAFVGSGLGAPDVALLRLATAVPANVATPAPLATSKPSNGTPLTIYGYGCNDDWEHQTGGGTKRDYGYRWGDRLVNVLCPGDSGGPVRVDSTGAVLLVNSGWMSSWDDPRHDVFGEVPQYVSKIQSQITAWNAPEPTHGLTAEYFDTKDLGGDAKATRVDATVDFDWGNGSPSEIVGNDGFAARWTGHVTAPSTDTYTLEVYSDDGVRLYVDEALVIDNWVDHSPVSSRASVSFTANESKSIRLEYYENGGGATAKLYWSAASQPRQIIPSARLAP
jgi:hypothetical protein